MVDRLLEIRPFFFFLPAGLRALFHAHNAEADELAGANLRQRRDVAGDHRRDFGIAAGALVVGEHHNRLAVGGNLHRALDNAVREDVHTRLGLDRRAAELGGHAVGILRDGVERGFEIKKTLFGEGVVLRAEHDAKQREFLRADEAVRAYQNQQKQIKDTEDFIERFRYKATKSVQVQSRIKQLEKLERIEVEEEDMARITVRFQPAVRSGEIVLTGKELTKAYGDHVVLKGIQLDIKRGEKIAFVGKNGEGKSTLVKMIMNEIPFEGELKIGHHVNIGYFAQNQADLLDPEVSVLDTVDRVAEGEIRKKIRDILGAFLFSGEEVDKKVKVLSGGERTRLAMVRLLLEPYNLLILDEPTNHLDMRTKDILKEALRKFEGTVIVVSHDRDFLTGLADKVYEFANQHIKEYLGGITDFLAAKKIACFREYEQLHKPKGNGISNDEAEREVSENKLSFEERKQLNKEIRKAEQRVERAEQRVTELESEVAALEKQMAAGVVNDELLKKYGETQKELEEAMTEWEKATEEEEEVKSKR